MPDAKTVYAEKALVSLPRLLSLLDRNPFSPTYGCFHRDYWLYKTADFPDAVRQFGVHALALSYAYDFGHGSGAMGLRTQTETRGPMTENRSPYYRNPHVRDWTIAALDFWSKIQHTDGSFDEFYPFERGWVGPTAFTTYASSEALRLLGTEIPGDVSERVRSAIRRAAHFIAAGETEEDHLANHHAMAYLAVSIAADVLNDDALRATLPKLWRGFLRYQIPDEGWSLEYDGADPGYLSATVSFLGKVYARHPSAELRNVLERAIEFCSYFVYPDGSYAGILGSRNTLHFYPHGFELLAPEFPLAGSIAERMTTALAEGKLVPPEIMSDRYVHYRVPEFLLAAVDTRPRPTSLPPLPYERPAFVRIFPKAGIVAAVHGPAYTLVNLAKGGVIKIFDRSSGHSLLSDSGWIGELEDGRLVTSQWIDPLFQQSTGQTRWDVRGSLQEIPSAKLFTLKTHLAFRLALVLLGWSPRASHWLKGAIRKSLILGQRPLPCAFVRTVEANSEMLTITDELRNDGGLRFRRLLLGGEIPVRYVPQSRFFQPHELESRGRVLSTEELRQVNVERRLRIVRTIELRARASTDQASEHRHVAAESPNV